MAENLHRILFIQVVNLLTNIGYKFSGKFIS